MIQVNDLAVPVRKAVEEGATLPAPILAAQLRSEAGLRMNAAGACFVSREYGMSMQLLALAISYLTAADRLTELAA